MHPKVHFLRINSMSKNFHQLFSLIEPEKSNDALKSAILGKIRKEQRKQLAIRFVASAMTFVSSVSLSVYSTVTILKSLSSSAFADLLMLVRSDLPTLLVYWKDFSYALLGLLPVTTISIFLIGLCLAIWSGRLMVSEQVRLKHN